MIRGGSISLTLQSGCLGILGSITPIHGFSAVPEFIRYTFVIASSVTLLSAGEFSKPSIPIVSVLGLRHSFGLIGTQANDLSVMEDPIAESAAWFASQSAWDAYPGVMTVVTIGVLIQSVLITFFMLNIFRRKKVEAALKQSESRFRQVVQSQRDMVCLSLIHI